MKVLLLFGLLFALTSSYAQTYRFVDAPVGFLREEPKVTAHIMIRLEEKTRVRIIEQISRTWSKVEYVYNAKRHIGYITNHTLSEESITRKKKPATK
ncbi:SH3 domain-containing protein [Rhodocytophaga rosea]|uniref:SH3 domain-containing protein n=1 Tax=Rhodocytophaga rosea TaxID=2704465 RepID=A0A6C0GNQ3_9BACT|nr:SH3 domain-containing protein [Rhodocytophaga rosea]QHT69681.1 SH3 domain-containing protein [Rhodocytophaga rosea]